jgi:hypothetical protein
LKVTKAVNMDEETARRIQALADRERRSFAAEVQVLLEAVLGSNPQDIPIEELIRGSTPPIFLPACGNRRENQT